MKAPRTRPRKGRFRARRRTCHSSSGSPRRRPCRSLRSGDRFARWPRSPRRKAPGSRGTRRRTGLMRTRGPRGMRLYKRRSAPHRSRDPRTRRRTPRDLRRNRPRRHRANRPRGARTRGHKPRSGKGLCPTRRMRRRSAPPPLGNRRRRRRRRAGRPRRCRASRRT